MIVKLHNSESGNLERWNKHAYVFAVKENSYGIAMYANKFLGFEEGHYSGAGRPFARDFHVHRLFPFRIWHIYQSGGLDI